jgi:hypothetical protein
MGFAVLFLQPMDGQALIGMTVGFSVPFARTKRIAGGEY